MKIGVILDHRPYTDVSFGLSTKGTEVVVLTKTIFFGRKKIVKGDVYRHRKDLRIGDEVYFKLTPYISENYVVKRKKNESC